MPQILVVFQHVWLILVKISTIDCCRELHQYAHDRKWFRPGHGDLFACLELYSKCQDGRFRREDHTGYKMPFFCTPLEVNDSSHLFV